MSVVKLIREFSGRTEVPIEVEDVVVVLRDWGVKDDIWFFPATDMDTGIMKGKIVHWEAPWNDGTTKRFADIYTAKTLPNPEKRLVECKELLHIIDPVYFHVNTERATDELIGKIVVPPELQDPFSDGPHVNSDRAALAHALAVLFPYAAREAFLPKFNEGKITLQQISDHVALPTKYVGAVMSESWAKVHEIMVRDVA